eukprot:gene21881-54187_t
MVHGAVSKVKQAGNDGLGMCFDTGETNAQELTQL